MSCICEFMRQYIVALYYWAIVLLNIVHACWGFKREPFKILGENMTFKLICIVLKK